MKTVLEEKEQFIVDSTGQRVGVLLDLSTYERLREAAEENEDIRSYRAAKSRVAAEIGRGDYTTLADYGSKRSRKRK
jgi:PHD/YefM family antitoxin component YafN of YafNO toxin-antitoxin module